MITIKESRYKFSYFFRNYDAVFQSKTAARCTWQFALMTNRILAGRGQLCPFFMLVFLLRSKMSFCPLRNTGVQSYACRLLVVSPATFASACRHFLRALVNSALISFPVSTPFFPLCIRI